MMSNFKKVLVIIRSSLDNYNKTKGSYRKFLHSLSRVMKSLTEWYNNASKLNVDVDSDHPLIEVQLTNLFSIFAKYAVKPTKTLSDWMIILLLPKVFSSQEIKYYLQKSALTEDIKKKFNTQLYQQAQFVNSKPALNHLLQTTRNPFAFFNNMHDELRYYIFQKLPNESLIQMKNVSKKDYNLAVFVLFKRRGSEACLYQQQIMENWLSSQKKMSILEEQSSQDDIKEVWTQNLFKDAISDPAGSLAHKLLCLMMSSKDSEKVNQFILMSENIFIALMDKLNDSHLNVRLKAIQVLETLASKLLIIPDNLITALMGKLNDHANVCQAAIQALVTLASKLSEAQLAYLSKILMGKLNDESRVVRRRAVKTLNTLASQLSIVPDNLITAFMSKLNHDDKFVRHALTQALVTLSSKLSDAQLANLITALRGKLNDDSIDVRCAAIQVLSTLTSKLSIIPDNLITTLMDKLNYDDYLISLMQTASRIPYDLNNEVMGMLNDDYHRINLAAIQALGTLASKLLIIPDNLITALRGKLNDRDIKIHKAAIQVLGTLSSKLSDAQLSNLFTALMDQLNDYDIQIRQAAIQVLGTLSSKLSDAQLSNLFTALMDKLNDRDIKIRQAAIQVLGTLSSKLSDAQLSNLFTVLMDKLNDRDIQIRQAAVQMLGTLSSKLSDAQLSNLFTALMDKLNDRDIQIRQAAIQVLGTLSSKLSDAQLSNLFTALMDKLNDRDIQIRQAAVQVLVTLASKLSDTQTLEDVFKSFPNDTLQSIEYHLAKYFFTALDIFAKSSASLTCSI